MTTILQIALDTDKLFKAVDLAVKIATSTNCSNIWLEAGTPLIKSWGRLSVKILKDLTNCFIVADTKTIDTGSFEADIFYGAGANAITVLGLADNSTILDAIRKAREYNGIVIADLINHPKPFERAIELAELGVDVVLYHVGIDVQKSRRITVSQLLNELRDLRSKISAKIAVAGGIKHGEARKFKEIGVDVVVVGSAITKADDPVVATTKFLEELKN
ncbi:MAG: orotidine 5'-phosphate decarboxylase / HUMPS family protein [Thermoprotei archaeon]